MTGREGRVLATAKTVQVGYDYEKGVTVAVPARYREGLRGIGGPGIEEL